MFPTMIIPDHPLSLSQTILCAGLMLHGSPRHRYAIRCMLGPGRPACDRRILAWIRLYGIVFGTNARRIQFIADPIYAWHRYHAHRNPWQRARCEFDALEAKHAPR